jgi:hypothetical protein
MSFSEGGIDDVQREDGAVAKADLYAIPAIRPRVDAGVLENAHEKSVGRTQVEGTWHTSYSDSWRRQSPNGSVVGDRPTLWR